MNLRNFFSKRKTTIFVFVAIIFNSIFIESSSDVVFFGVVGLYIGAVFFYKLYSKLTFLFCFALLVVIFSEYIFTGASLKTEKTSVWFFLFLTIGIIQQWREDKKPSTSSQFLIGFFYQQEHFFVEIFCRWIHANEFREKPINGCNPSNIQKKNFYVCRYSCF